MSYKIPHKIRKKSLQADTFSRFKTEAEIVTDAYSDVLAFILEDNCNSPASTNEDLEGTITGISDEKKKSTTKKIQKTTTPTTLIRQ